MIFALKNIAITHIFLKKVLRIQYQYWIRLPPPPAPTCVDSVVFKTLQIEKNVQCARMLTNPEIADAGGWLHAIFYIQSSASYKKLRSPSKLWMRISNDTTSIRPWQLVPDNWPPCWVSLDHTRSHNIIPVWFLPITFYPRRRNSSKYCSLLMFSDSGTQTRDACAASERFIH